MKRLIGVALTLMLFGSLEPASARCIPKYVLKIVVSLDTAESPRKTIYRTGERFGRIEDPPSVIVVNEPDVWTVNPALRVGEHARDRDDDLVFRALIVDDFGSEHWNNFEYGCEVPFMRAVGSVPEPVAGSDERVYEHSAEGVTARLTVSKSDVPLRMDVRKGDATYVVIYHAWQELRDAPKALFEMPDGVRWTPTFSVRNE